MVQSLSVSDTVTTWVDVCSLDAIAPNTGVCALVAGEQVAIFRVGNGMKFMRLAITIRLARLLCCRGDLWAIATALSKLLLPFTNKTLV